MGRPLAASPLSPDEKEALERLDDSPATESMKLVGRALGIVHYALKDEPTPLSRLAELVGKSFGIRRAARVFHGKRAIAIAVASGYLEVDEKRLVSLSETGRNLVDRAEAKAKAEAEKLDPVALAREGAK